MDECHGSGCPPEGSDFAGSAFDLLRDASAVRSDDDGVGSFWQEELVSWHPPSDHEASGQSGQSLGSVQEADSYQRSVQGGAGLSPEPAPSIPSKLSGLEVDPNSYRHLLRVSHNSLREELPKLPWDEGFWGDFFKPVVTTDDLVAFPKFDRATPPVEYLKEALEADDQPGPKRARKVANVTFERVVLNRAVISWRDQREADMSRALVKWCAVLESWNSEVATVTSQLHEAVSPEACQDLLGDYLARKAPSTCLKRANSMLRLGKYAASNGYTMPVSESSLYKILRDCKAGGASLSQLRGIMEAVTFVHYTFDVTFLLPCVKSRRCWGLSSAKQATLAVKADPFTVSDILELHRILYEGDDPWDRLMCGVALFCIYARCRWSDVQHVDSMNLEFDEQGFAEFGSALIDVHKTMNFSAKLPKTMELVAVGRGLDGMDWLSSFMSVRTLLGIEFDKGFPCMPAPDKSGAPTVRALGSDEAGAWLQELLPGREGSRTTSHSLKATLLSFAAKRGLTHIDRLALGGHYHGAHMSDVYARDALARPLRLLAGMLTEIRLGKFLPDSGRAARFPGRSNEEIIGVELPTGAVVNTDASQVTVTSSEAVPVPASGTGGRSVGNCESGNLLSSSPWDLISTVSDPQTLQDGHSVPKNSPAASNEAVSVKSDATDPPKDELLAPWGSPVACDGAMSVKSDDTDPPSPDFPEGVIDLDQSTEPDSFGGVGLVSQDISEVNPDDGATSDGDTSSESSSSESSQEDEPEPRLMHPPAPPEGTFFVQHRKLRTLHLLLEGHRSFTLCGRSLLSEDSAFGEPGRIRYDTPVCKQCKRSLANPGRL